MLNRRDITRIRTIHEISNTYDMNYMDLGNVKSWFGARNCITYNIMDVVTLSPFAVRSKQEQRWALEDPSTALYQEICVDLILYRED